MKGDQIEVCSILNGYDHIDNNIVFSVKDDRRIHKIQNYIKKEQCRLNIRKFSFIQRTVNEWNRLSADCVGANTVNV